MNSEWIKSTAASRVIGLFSDPRPVWLWSGDGSNLLWCNPAARIFRGRIKRDQLKLAPLARPIKGQVARLVRLGSVERASLSRVQFETGARPSSATCRCTPLQLGTKGVALLIVAVDPVEKKTLSAHGRDDEIVARTFGADIKFALVDKRDQIIAGSVTQLPSADPAQHVNGEQDGTLRFPMSQGGNSILVFPAQKKPQSEYLVTSNVPSDIAGENDLTADEELDADAALGAVDLEINTGIEPEVTTPKTDTPAARPHGLTSLLDELAMNEALFAPLGPDDDESPVLPVPSQPERPQQSLFIKIPSEVEKPVEVEEDKEIAPTDDDPALWQITGHGFTAETDLPESDDTLEEQASEAREEETDGAQSSSRYNFDELSRILTDRVGSEPQQDASEPETLRAKNSGGALVNLSDENLVLNRLPLGLLIFRDQQLLFANRAMTELVGYPDTASLRDAGLSAIFPSATETIDPVGPITQLVHRNQSEIPVTARLQVISWQGRSAFMLTAKNENAPLGTEESVRAFAQTLAATDGTGFFEASRDGILDAVSGRAAELFKRSPETLIGRPLMILVGHEAAAPLRDFLEQPARFAGTQRPGISLQGIDTDLQILLFAEGQAGIVTGYFGLVQQSAEITPSVDREIEVLDPSFDAAMLSRVSRGMRRPLNTIVGFAELIRTNAFGPIENPRYVEYAGDIKSAGNDIAEALDELEEFTDLSDGQYEADRALINLGLLLDKCLARVRIQANRARVLVRSAISESLPKIRADEPSLSQAVLNLLASAIEQTPEGGQVVVSAQLDEDGTVFVHVRDSGVFEAEMAERFTVFRDGFDLDGEARLPIKSSVGLALTRSLLAVNACTLSIDPTPSTGTLLTLAIPSDLAVAAE